MTNPNFDNRNINSASAPCPRKKAKFGSWLLRVQRSDTGALIEGATVDITGPSPSSGKSTKGAGGVLLQGLEPGRYRATDVTFKNLDGYAKAELASITQRRVLVRAGATVVSTVVIRPPAAARVKTIDSVKGGEKGSKPEIGGVTVTLAGPETPAATKTEADGIAPFKELIPGTYTVTLTLDEELQKHYVVPQPRQITLTEGKDLLVVLPLVPLPTIEVTVVGLSSDGKVKTPVEAIKVKLAGVAAKEDASAATTGIATFPSLQKGDYEVSVELTPEQRAKYKPPKAAAKVDAPPGKVTKVTVELQPVELTLVSVDDHFAPSKEQLDIKYTIKSLDDQVVKLRVTSAHADVNPIYERELTAGEKTDGDHTVQWDGKATVASGALKDKFIHPLLSPYKVELYHSDPLKGEKPFKVLYHSLTLRQGPWTPDEAEPPKTSERDWVQYKLNTLGYYGGPVGKDTEDYLKKAIIRYKANHETFFQLNYAGYNDTITDPLKTALENNQKQRQFLKGGDAITDSGKEAKVMVELLTYQGDEFSTAQKHVKERERLNRPLIPIEADVMLKTKGDAAVWAPDAVGPARVNWVVRYSDQDISPLEAYSNAEPSRTRSFVEKALKLQGGRAGATGDNCHQNFGGLRNTDEANQYSPFLIGDFYVPYVSDKDTAQKVVYSKACVDKATYPKRLGRAGIFFRPSYIAGDGYALTAELDFTGLPNATDLEAFHGVTARDKRIKKDTGKFRVWRFGRVAALINWPARVSPPAVFGGNEWDGVRSAFEKAFIELDTASIITRAMSAVVTEEDYRDVVTASTTHTVRGDITLKPNALVGVDLPAQGALAADEYKSAINQFTNADFYDLIYKDLRVKISESIRRVAPDGFVVVDFLTHVPIDVERDPANGDNTVVDADFVTWTFSIGLPDSVIYLDQRDPDKVYYVVAHEAGHNLFLKHWQNAGGIPAEHDLADTNCIMSYSSSNTWPHQVPGTYTPHFCGKCNLKLRGWNVTAIGMPAAADLDPHVAVAVAVDRPNPTMGQTVTWTFTVTNNGPGAAAGVVVKDNWPGGLPVQQPIVAPGGTAYDLNDGRWTVGNLANGVSKTLQLRTDYGDAAGDEAGDAQKLKWTAFVEAPVSAVRDEDAHAEINVASADLTVGITATNATPEEGETLDYTVSVTNNGPDAASGVQLTITWPADLTYGSNLASQGAYTSGTRVWDVGAIPSGTTHQLALRSTVNAGTQGRTISFTAAVTASEQYDPDTTDNTATLDVTVKTVVLAIAIAAGATIRQMNWLPFTITVTNTGTGRAKGVVVRNTRPANGWVNAVAGYTEATGVWDAVDIAAGGSHAFSSHVCYNNATVGVQQFQATIAGVQNAATTPPKVVSTNITVTV